MKQKNPNFSLEKVALSPLQCYALNILLSKDYPLSQKELAKQTKTGVSGISKALDGLCSLGLVATLKQAVKSFFINPIRKEEVKKFLTGYDLGKNKPLVLSGHAFTYEAEINDLPDKLAKKLEKDKSYISYNPRHWKYAYKKALIDGSFKLHKTAKGCKLIAYFRTFGFNPAIIEQINTEKFLRLKSDLEEEYMGLKIGNAKCIATCPWQEYAIQRDPIATVGIALGIKHKNIEQSYGYPEWEEKGFNAREKIEKIIALREKEKQEAGL
jgi:hypothetical protein